MCEWFGHCNLRLLWDLFIYLFIYKRYFIDYAITVVPLLLLYSPLPCAPPPTHIPPPALVHVRGSYI